MYCDVELVVCGDVVFEYGVEEVEHGGGEKGADEHKGAQATDGDFGECERLGEKIRECC